MPQRVFSGFEAVVFDFDGTLVDGLDAIHKCFVKAFREMSISPPSKEQVRSEIGMPLLESTRRFLGLEGQELLDETVRIYREEARRTLPEKTRFKPGARRALHLLHQNGIKLGIATTKNSESTIATLHHLQADHLFSVVSGIDDVKHPKPDPEQIEFVLARLGVQPQKAAMVGDTFVDILAARAAKLLAIAVLDGFGDRDRLIDAGPDYTIEKSEYLPEMLGKIILGI